MTALTGSNVQPTASAPSRAGSVCLANAQLVLPDRVLHGRVHVADGLIREIAEGDVVPAEAIDCQGDYVMPGLVELHTDNLERHIEPRPHVDWPHLPALIAHDAELASTGITTVFDAMRVGSIPRGKTRYKAYARSLASELLSANAQGLFKISHLLHLRAEICSETLMPELAEFGHQDRVGIVSLMDHTPGQRQFRDLGLLKTYLTKKNAMTDAEFSEHVDRLRGLQETYGAEHSKGAVSEARRLGAVLASHDDTTPAEVAQSQAQGVRFAEFPTTLAAAQACRDTGTAIMMGAPNLIRGKSHSGNISAVALAGNGLLDILSSDYVPSALLLSAMRLADIWQDLPRAIACVTANPAKASGLGDRGMLAKDMRGDVIRVRSVPGGQTIQGVWSGGVRVS